MSRDSTRPGSLRLRHVVCPAGAVVLGFLGFRCLSLASKQGAYLEAVGPAILSVGLLAGAGVLLVIPFVGALSSPFGDFFARLFLPTETLRRPPDELLAALRMRLRDRYWDSVDQQTRALIDAYGASPELYHLRALMDGGRTGSHSATTVEASERLSARAFRRYTDLLHRDPPPRETQTGIDA